MRRRKSFLTSLIAAISIFTSLLFPTSAPALSFNSAPATKWGYIYAAPKSDSIKSVPKAQHETSGVKKSDWNVTYNDFPSEAKSAVQQAIDIWSENFTSKVPINVDATWETNSNTQILGSARPGYYFNAFPGSPDDDLWYPSALANALSGRDLNPKEPEVVLRINSNSLWYTGTDGKPSPRSYDLSSVVLHEIGHGLGFLSNAEYDRYFGTGYMFQPTPFDAYVQLGDGRTFTDFCSRSTDLGKAMINPLYWSGAKGVAANKGAKPRLFTPTPYLEGSSITHLDEETFKNSPTDALMTPNLEPGESFSTPGPIAIGMIEDMLSKPPLGVATGLPAKPINVKALVGDKYSLVTFDSPNCRSVDRVTGYTVTVNQTGSSRKFDSSPAKISGLQNGKSYTFSVTADNERGSSESVVSNSVTPQKSGSTKILDTSANVTQISAITYKGKQTIIYGDDLNRQLKMATLNGVLWKATTLKKNVNVGSISLCKSGTGSKETLHLFYADLESKDIKYGALISGKWKYSTVDGDGETIQDYKEKIRARTASDVSVSNACAATPSGLQVFYRDETQGILLGATRTSTGWVYEIVDGDRTSDGRTTGDVGFHISAIALGKSVYVLYDSVLTINSSKIATEGEVRIATRRSIYPEDWKYSTLDGPDNSSAVAGYATALHVSQGQVIASWLSATGNTLPNPSQIKFARILDDSIAETISPTNFGNPSAPLIIDGKGFVFGCSQRICKADYSPKSSKLASGSNVMSPSGAIITINKKRYLVTSINKKLTLLSL